MILSGQVVERVRDGKPASIIANRHAKLIVLPSQGNLNLLGSGMAGYVDERFLSHAVKVESHFVRQLAQGRVRGEVKGCFQAILLAPFFDMRPQSGA